MTSDTQQNPAATEATAPTQQEGPQEVPKTPEELMKAATARIAQLETEAAEIKDRWMRAEAEMANVRARARREVEETRQFAVQKFAADVVEAVENVRRGFDSLGKPEPGQPEIVARLRDGLEGIERSLLGILERNGIRREDPTGQSFDPNLHQAMAEEPSTDYGPGTVSQAWTPVWTLNGRLLRPAMVVVARAPAEAPAPGGDKTKVDTTA
jgi:molecular chaperone GrpE